MGIESKANLKRQWFIKVVVTCSASIIFPDGAALNLGITITILNIIQANDAQFGFFDLGLSVTLYLV
jgi:hypothetical protein